MADFVKFKFKDWFFDTATVMRAVDSANIRNLSKAGAFVRQRAKSSIRTAPKKPIKAWIRGGRIGQNPNYSSPGKPPYSHFGLLKSRIFFAYDASRRSVIIGPEKIGAKGKDVPYILEHGGPVEGTRVKRGAHMEARPFMLPALEAEQNNFAELWKDSVR